MEQGLKEILEEVGPLNEKKDVKQNLGPQRDLHLSYALYENKDVRKSEDSQSGHELKHLKHEKLQNQKNRKGEKINKITTDNLIGLSMLQMQHVHKQTAKEG